MYRVKSESAAEDLDNIPEPNQELLEKYLTTGKRRVKKQQQPSTTTPTTTTPITATTTVSNDTLDQTQQKQAQTTEPVKPSTSYERRLFQQRAKKEMQK